MLANYLKTALWSLLRYRLHAATNIVGLAMGMACSLLVFTYVWHESSYESFNEHADQVFRVRNGDGTPWSSPASSSTSFPGHGVCATSPFCSPLS